MRDNDEKLDMLFDEKYYLNLKWKVDAPYMDRHVLLEEMPTVYDNIIYAKGITGKDIVSRFATAQNARKVNNTVTYKTCVRMQLLESTINNYAAKYNIPANKLLGLIFLESEGKANTGNKWLWYPYNCYGYTQISVQVWKKYWAITKNDQGQWIDWRDDLATALDTTCRFLTDIHKRRTDHGHDDNNRSLTFASYHMWETHMSKILRVAHNKANMKADNMQDLIGLNNKEVGSEFMELKDESYKYYPKLLAAWRIYDLFKWNRWQFNHNIEEFINSPIRRKPSLAEEYIWHWSGPYYDKNTDLKQDMEEWGLFWAKSKPQNLEIDHNIWQQMFISKQEKNLSPHQQSTLKRERQEWMRMSSKATRWLIKFISYYFPYHVKVTSLTRSQEYNDRIYNSHGKWTSHATGMALDLWFPAGIENKRYLKWILYGLEVQGKIAFLQEKNHFHITINPKYKSYFEWIIDG